MSEWAPIATAEKTTRIDIQIITREGVVHPCCHWASDLTGEDQPAFQGWFYPIMDDTNEKILYYNQVVNPLGWKPV